MILSGKTMLIKPILPIERVNNTFYKKHHEGEQDGEEKKNPHSSRQHKEKDRLRNGSTKYNETPSGDRKV